MGGPLALWDAAFSREHDGAGREGRRELPGTACAPSRPRAPPPCIAVWCKCVAGQLQPARCSVPPRPPATPPPAAAQKRPGSRSPPLACRHPREPEAAPGVSAAAAVPDCSRVCCLPPLLSQPVGLRVPQPPLPSQLTAGGVVRA